MTYEEIQNLIIFEGITGSHAYGTSLPTSDVDTRGLFVLPKEKRITIFDIPEEVEKSGEDTKFFELKKAISLFSKATPNMIELLWLPTDCIKRTTPKWDILMANRQMFITKVALKTHSAYAFAQIKKATGQNKLVNNPITEKPDRLDFCLFIPAGDKTCVTMPFKDTKINPNECRVTKLPHMDNSYLLFDGGDGIFKGDMLACKDIPEKERSMPLGIFIYHPNDYTFALNKYKEYQDWLKVRNPARWNGHDGKPFDYDRKNMLHTLRLMFSAENIIKNGEPLVRFSGKDLEFLRKIREDAFTYEYLMSIAQEKMAFIEEGEKTCKLPEKCDSNAVDQLFKELAE